MQTATRGGLRLDSIDDYLGPAAGRFFGSGYRRVTETLSELRFQPGPDGSPQLRGTAAVEFPADWSTKRRGEELAPHLSTVDALVFAARLAEFQLSRTLGLSPEQRRRLWLRRVEIKAGQAPDEQRLDRIPVTARSAGATVTATVGAMSVRLQAAGLPEQVGRPGETAPPALEPIREQLYGTGYRHAEQTLTGVELDTEAEAATATARVTPGQTGPGVGLEGAYQPSVSLIDAFVLALQLGQVLLYERDGVARSESETLWMRRTVLDAPRPLRPAAAELPMAARLEDSRLLLPEGQRWRVADIVSEVAGIGVRCSVTHRLP